MRRQQLKREEIFSLNMKSEHVVQAKSVADICSWNKCAGKKRRGTKMYGNNGRGKKCGGERSARGNICSWNKCAGNKRRGTRV
jgi:hypothetical protein